MTNEKVNLPVTWRYVYVRASTRVMSGHLMFAIIMNTICKAVRHNLGWQCRRVALETVFILILQRPCYCSYNHFFPAMHTSSEVDQLLLFGDLQHSGT